MTNEYDDGHHVADDFASKGRHQKKKTVFFLQKNSRAATSIGNTDFLSVTDLFAQKGGKPNIFGIFLGIFIGNFPKLPYLV